MDAMPGWPGHQWWGYHGDDGNIFFNSGSSGITYEKYGQGDVIGYGLDLQGGIFFTKNGKKQGEYSCTP
ncbi:hypothetical protein BDD12DRAFT_871367 [Trichophaea hybrida]|nr:hypothetical protein BDD12DRAFT_871367 [Trichophaea hybrida]